MASKFTKFLSFTAVLSAAAAAGYVLYKKHADNKDLIEDFDDDFDDFVMILTTWIRKTEVIHSIHPRCFPMIQKRTNRNPVYRYSDRR